MFKVLTEHMKDKNIHTINTLPSNNIERFDCYAGMVLGHLYRNFPLPITITAENFIDYPTLRANARGDLEKEENLFMATIKWLADVGFIHFEGLSNVSFFEVVLTSNGLLILRGLPAGNESGSTIGEKLSQCVKDNNSIEMQVLVGEALSLGSRLMSPMIRTGI